MSLNRSDRIDPLELALTAPARYHDYRIKNYIDFEDLVLDVEILHDYKSDRIWRLEAFAHNVAQNVELIFFRTSSYHRHTFAPKARLYITGRLQKNHGKLQILQPQKIANYKIGTIFAEYKVPMRADRFYALKNRVLNPQNLLQEGLPQDVVDALMQIHYPCEEFFRAFKKKGEFWGRYLEALKFTEAFWYLRKLRAKRNEVPSLCQIQKRVEPFYEQLPFKPTSDQKEAIADIAKDLASPKAARRVIVGDVGSGKSLVMFAVAYLTYPKRAILMAPTTILADQLYQEAKKLLPDEIKVALVSGESKEEDLLGYHFIIGTHALLYRKLPKACVVMVDEQHRFGTEQRNRLKKMVETPQGAPHFFQFSATPIPRTQAMMQSALVDFSFIRQTPFKKDITTEVITKKDFKRLLAHIEEEIEQGRQVLVVYPLVEGSQSHDYKSLEEAQSFWQERFDGVFVTHGKDREKEEILRRFRSEGKILLSTTVIEVGISLPKLSTVVVVGAENMGLATLHQLRGRVSRTGLKGYCFLYTNDPNNERLQAFSKLTSGFDVAELDLRYRKAGDIVSGKDQSGKTFRWLSMAEDAKIIERAKALLS
ncbi:MAG: ATP-dependent DNA helicase RecG [Epsilonproteobacteria bacterium]|nr:ATP-dependent DNA helicase RecG [Campylobacterota bacterium]NPA65076.1 ATP-dependent DNA helicase RecG [Campylobacterota bacterium]